LEQVVKPIPAIGGRIEETTTDGVICLISGCCLAAFDDSLLSGFLQTIIQSVYQPVSRLSERVTDYLGTSTFLNEGWRDLFIDLSSSVAAALTTAA
jgi:hypothetical protein